MKLIVSLLGTQCGLVGLRSVDISQARYHSWPLLPRGICEMQRLTLHPSGLDCDFQGSLIESNLQNKLSTDSSI